MSDTSTNPVHYVAPTFTENVGGDVSVHPKEKSQTTAERIAAEAGYILSQGGGVF